MRQATTSNFASALSRFGKSNLPAGFLAMLALTLTASAGYARRATWSLNPISDDWNTAANWTPNHVPEIEDTAIFSASNQTQVFISTQAQVDRIVFDAGASPFAITCSGANLLFNGPGIRNTSGIIQNFVAESTKDNVGGISFSQSSNAGNSTNFTVDGAPAGGSESAIINFFINSSAGDATFTVNGGQEHGGQIFFGHSSTAGSAIFTTNGGIVGSLFGGGLISFNGSTASSATFINNGGVGINTGGSHLDIFGPSTTTAGAATLIANSGLEGGEGAVIVFSQDAAGGSSRVEVFGNGSLDISGHNSPGITTGSLEGSGLVFLGARNLTVGSNNLSTAFSGQIQDGGIVSDIGGSLSKTGQGTLTLSKTNTYTGGTRVSRGALLVTNKTGSGTGTGPLRVNGGTLGGNGRISGLVTIALGTRPAVLAPGRGASPGTLTILRALKFNSPATYKVDLDSNTVVSDQVIANGVTIKSGASFFISDLGNGALPAGTIFLVISNTATTSISGAFGNLADGASFTLGSNTFQADYEGGDGNDLTLTVVP